MSVAQLHSLLSQASKFVQHSSPWSPHHVYILQVYSSHVQYSSQIIFLNYIFTDVLIPSQGLMFELYFVELKQVKCSLKHFCLPICQVLLPATLGATHSGGGVGCHTWGRLPVPPARTLHAHGVFSCFITYISGVIHACALMLRPTHTCTWPYFQRQ